jgi:flagellar hook protein FlgE
MRVQGKGFDATGVLTNGDPSDIRVTNVGLIGARATDELTFTTNLDENAAQLGAGAIDPANRATYNYSAPGQVYDSLGQSHSSPSTGGWWTTPPTPGPWPTPPTATRPR